MRNLILVIQPLSRLISYPILNGALIMLQKIFLALFTTVLLLGCGFAWRGESPTKSIEGWPPEILAFHADQVIRPGDTWRVYLKIKDVDCDMSYIITDVWQSGVGQYPVSFTPIRETGCRPIMGYVFLKTPADQALLSDQFEVRIFVRDRQGNRSELVNLPLTFDLISAKKPPEQWRVASIISLGAIQTNLVSSPGTDSGRE